MRLLSRNRRKVPSRSLKIMHYHLHLSAGAIIDCIDSEKGQYHANSARPPTYPGGLLPGTSAASGSPATWYR